MLVQVKVGILFVVGLLLIVGSVIFQLYFNNIFENILAKKLILQPDSETIKSFKDPPVPIYMQYYFFNVTNKEDVLENGNPPILQQVGPYTYAEKQIKYDLHFDNDAGTVSFYQNKSFIFRPDMSGSLRETDEITTVNAVMISVASKFDSLPKATQSILELLFLRFQVEPFITKPVGELLFYGYNEPFLESIGRLTKNPVHLTGKFGFYYLKNNTHGGRYTINSGLLGMEDYQNIVTWKGESQLTFWKQDMYGGDTCNMINGTTGNQFPKPITPYNRIWLYTAELCRSIFAVFQKKVYHGPLKLYRFVLPDYLLANSPENKCFCHDDFTCRASMINVATCREGSPVVMSTPHFYQGDPNDLTFVKGLNPVAEEHQTYLDLEPNTGVTFRAAKRIQLNMPLKRYSNLPAFRNVPEVIMPIFWVNESAVVPMERTEALYRSLTLPHTLVQVATWVLIGLGCLLIIVGIVKLALLIRHKRRLKKSPTANNRAQKDKEREKHKVVSEKLNSLNYS